MSRRDLSQASFVDAMVSGYGKVGGFLDPIAGVPLISVRGVAFARPPRRRHDLVDPITWGRSVVGSCSTAGVFHSAPTQTLRSLLVQARLTITRGAIY
jgi:hypothetical protein